MPLQDAYEKRRPLTRKLIDETIAKFQKDLDEALSRKEYEKCPTLQEKLDDLLMKRNEFPTIEEIKQKLKEAEIAVQEAVESRDFVGAASKQLALSKAKLSLEEALKEEFEENSATQEEKKESNDNCDKQIEENQYDARADLESQIVKAAKEVEKAIEQKQFQNASKLQESLDKLESYRVQYPTISEMEEELHEKERVLTDTIKSKKFDEAGSLQNEIDELKSNINKEKSTSSSMNCEEDPTITANQQNVLPSARLLDGTVKEFESRIELEQIITQHENEVETAVATKNFSKATELQDLVDDLQKLRNFLKSLAELRQELISYKKKWNKQQNQRILLRQGICIMKSKVLKRK